MITSKDYENLTKASELMVQMASEEDPMKRALLISQGVYLITGVMFNDIKTTMDSIDVPDFMKTRA